MTGTRLTAIRPNSTHETGEAVALGELAEPSNLHIRTLAVCAVEVIQGLRSLDQIGGWVTPGVLASITTQRALRTERNTLYRDQRRVVSTPGRVVTSVPAPGKVDSAIVMHNTHRSFAVAMRFEYIRSKWRATELFVL